ncbi:hypothetical protein A3765_22555 [Oleiphilus sp. HI0130]|nr:hypothetical protein A3765_22555 [Oleiphilus sp. HI0130]
MKEIATNSLRYNELRDDIYELKREQNMAHHAMESYGASLVCLGLEAYGYILEEDQYFNQAERNEFMFSQGQRWNSRFDPFDFILSDIEGEKLGLYICLATPAGGLYPIRAFVPPNEDIGIEPRIALIVVKGEDIHFFLVPLEDIGTRKPLLRVRGRDTENPVYFLGRSNITHLKDSFDIKIKKLSHQERLARQSRIMQGVLEHMQNPEE